jgi:predicted Zn-dependent protease
MGALGAGAKYGTSLPFSRKQESEADHIGLLYMARAGYDPKEAVAFWQRMDAEVGKGAPPQFLSDHPSHNTRIADLQTWMPEAEKEYAQYHNRAPAA